MKRILYGICALVFLLSFVGTFIGEIRWMPTPSMENTIMVHSLVWTDKTQCGASMPRKFWDSRVWGFVRYENIASLVMIS